MSIGMIARPCLYCEKPLTAPHSITDCCVHLLGRAKTAERELDEARLWTADDKPLPEDAAIRAAHPIRSGEHERYQEAQRLVGAKRSKYALVDLINWLLAAARPTKHGSPVEDRGDHECG